MVFEADSNFSYEKNRQGGYKIGQPPSITYNIYVAGNQEKIAESF